MPKDIQVLMLMLLECTQNINMNFVYILTDIRHSHDPVIAIVLDE